MKVVAWSRHLGQKREVSQNKEPPIVSLPKEDRKTETIPCSWGIPPPHGPLLYTPPPTPLQAHLHLGANLPAGKARIKAAQFSPGHQRCRGKKVKGRAKHLEKPKSSLSLTTGHRFMTNTRFQIHLPSGAWGHLRNSMTHPRLLPRHCVKTKGKPIAGVKPNPSGSSRVLIKPDSTYGVKDSVSCCSGEIIRNCPRSAAIKLIPHKGGIFSSNSKSPSILSLLQPFDS